MTFLSINIRQLMIKNIHAVLFLSILIVFFATQKCEAASDIEIKLYISNELNSLPNYCQVRLAEVYFEKGYPDRKNINWPPLFMKSLSRWKNSIGPQNWTYFHHYCFGIKDYNDYSAMDSYNKNRFKQHQMKKALGQFEFMRKANTLNFPLWTDLYRYEALIYTELGNIEKAQWAIQQSLKHRRK